MTALAQFDKALESLLGTKAPGVSGSKVQELTKLAVQNVKVRSPLPPLPPFRQEKAYDVRIMLNLLRIYINISDCLQGHINLAFYTS